MEEPMAEADTQVFRVLLNPKLYRDIEIPSSKKLYDLASAIVAAFGFDFDHPFGFYSMHKGNILQSPIKYELFADMADMDIEGNAGSVKRTRICEAFHKIGHKMTFLFDYGDNWEFRVELIGENTKERGAKYPRVVKKVGTAPEQYPREEEDEEEH
jgi:Plasmid pRiA4b ORF-3-like protein